MTDGFVKMWRLIMEWQWYKDPHMPRVFIHLLLNANFKEKQWNGITIMPGQLVTSADKIGQELGLGRQVCRTCINRLISTNEITTKPTNKYTLITITNWAIYQSNDVDANHQNNHESNQQLTINQPSINHQLTTNKKEKKEKKIYSFAQTSTSVVSLTSNTGEELWIPKEKIDELQVLYPNTCVLNEFNRMKGWLMANPSKRKTASGIMRFITGWLDREQNRPGLPQAAWRKESQAPDPPKYKNSFEVRAENMARAEGRYQRDDDQLDFEEALGQL